MDINQYQARMTENRLRLERAERRHAIGWSLGEPEAVVRPTLFARRTVRPMSGVLEVQRIRLAFADGQAVGWEPPRAA